MVHGLAANKFTKHNTLHIYMIVLLNNHYYLNFNVEQMTEW